MADHASGVAEGAHVHADHRGEDAERKRLLIILMRDEYACTVEDPYRRWPASGVPHAIGVRGDSKLGGERRLRTRQGFPTRTEGLWWHGPPTMPLVGGTGQGVLQSANI